MLTVTLNVKKVSGACGLKAEHNTCSTAQLCPLASDLCIAVTVVRHIKLNACIALNKRFVDDLKMCSDVRAAAATLPNKMLGALPAVLPELMCRCVRELARPPTGSPCISAAVSNSPHHVLTLCSPNTVMTASLCLFKTRRGMLWFAEAFGVVPSPTHKHNPESDSRSFCLSLSFFILSCRLVLVEPV